MELKKKTLIKVKNPLPKTLEESLEILIDFYKESLDEIKRMTEDEFIGSSHHGAGQFTRNEWFLWWYPTHTFDVWPKEQPSLNKWFESIGIVHADDMSGILLTCLYRKLHNIPYGINEQVEYYKKHWRAEGFPDGIPTR